MFKRIIFLFTTIFFLVSCDFFQKKELQQNQVVDTIVDFNSVDVFPLFPSCDSIPSEERQKICSQIKLSEQIYASLAAYQIKVSEKMNDTILVKLHVNSIGNVSLVNIQSSEFIKKQIPKLDSLIGVGVNNLPTLKAAIKRGIPVTTEFTLPIVLVN